MKTTLQKVEELINKDRKSLQGLKNLALKNEAFELAAELREIEIKKYPKAKSSNKSYKEADGFRTCLRMTELGMSLKQAYIALETAKSFIEKGGKFDMDTATTIVFEAKEIFGEEN